jgi:microcystin-dependent protein
MFGGNFAPAGWAFCDGQLMPISENDAMFTLIGTTYGGDGQETFGLPDLQGRIPMHVGPGFQLAQSSGSESVTLTTQQIPVHSHAPFCSDAAGTGANPAGNVGRRRQPEIKCISKCRTRRRRSHRLWFKWTRLPSRRRAAASRMRIWLRF